MKLLKEDETLDDLQIRGIHVIQKKDSFRFGVDAVLLANYAVIKRSYRVIDLCSGTGIVPFIIAGKTEASSIVGVEIQEELVDMANRTIEYNGFKDRISFVQGDLKDLKLMKSIEKADVVTVNPPYKLCNSGIINKADNKAISRHEICCNIEDVIVAARMLLKDNGRLFMVHRPERIADILCAMRKHKIEPKAIKLVHPSAKKAPNIVLIEGQRDGGKYLKWDNPLYVHNEDGSYTDEINKIYGRV